MSESALKVAESQVHEDQEVFVAAETENRADIVHDKLKEIQSTKLRELLDRQAKLVKRIADLSKLPDMAEAERQSAIINAELNSVRTEIAKRQEDVGSLANELFALYDELGLQSQKAGKDTSEDVANREAASDAVTRAMEAVAEAKAQVGLKEEALTSTSTSWFIIGRDGRTAKAQESLDSARGDVTIAEERLDEAQNNIAIVEEQIQVDKADRVRKSSLSENFALIREFTSNATKVLKSDIEETEKRSGATQKALNSALTKKQETASALDDLRDKIKKSERDISREQAALGEIPDQGSSMYAKQQGVVSKIETRLTRQRGQELKLNTTLMAMTQAIEANKSSLAGLQMQQDTSHVYLIKLSAAEKTAEVLGRNIDRMVKNATQETASDALDRVTDSMTMTAVTLGIQAEVASAKTRNDAIERHDELMKQLTTARDSGDKAVAIEAGRYIELDNKIRKGYAARGIDIDMGHLQSAVETFAEKEEATPAGDEITY